MFITKKRHEPLFLIAVLEGQQEILNQWQEHNDKVLKRLDILETLGYESKKRYDELNERYLKIFNENIDLTNFVVTLLDAISCPVCPCTIDGNPCIVESGSLECRELKRKHFEKELTKEGLKEIDR